MEEKTTKILPSEPIKNSKHEKVCQLIASGKKEKDAYREVYTDCNSIPACRASVGKLLAKDTIKHRIEWLMKQSSTEKTLTRIKKREFLAEVLDGSFQDLMNEDGSFNAEKLRKSRIVRKVTQNKDGLSVEVYHKIDAIKVDNDMTGDNAPKQVNHQINPLEHIFRQVTEAEEVKRLESDTPIKAKVINVSTIDTSSTTSSSSS